MLIQQLHAAVLRVLLSSLVGGRTRSIRDSAVLRAESSPTPATLMALPAGLSLVPSSTCCILSSTHVTQSRVP